MKSYYVVSALCCLLIIVAFISSYETNMIGSAEPVAVHGGELSAFSITSLNNGQSAEHENASLYDAIPLDRIKALPSGIHPALSDGRKMDSDKLLKCLYYDNNGFYRADAISKPYQVQGSQLLSATSPHFMPAMDFTAGMLKAMAQKGNWDTIFVAGPNHKALGLPAIVSYADWETPFGMLRTDKQALDMLMHCRQLRYSIGTDDRIMEQEHSLSTLMPFIQYYLPGVKVVPLLLSKAALPEDLDAIAEVIYEIGKTKKVFLFCSVDFSHYESIDKVPVYDKETEDIIIKEDIGQLKRLSNAYIDSPETVYVFMRYASYYPDRRLELLDGVIMPESEINRAVGYSYYVYAYSQLIRFKAHLAIF